MNDANNVGDRAVGPGVQSASVMLAASSPFVAMAAILWQIFAMDRGRFAWSEWPVLIAAVGSVVIGILGGLYLATCRSVWWGLVAVLSAVVGYLEFQVLIASALGHMH